MQKSKIGHYYENFKYARVFLIEDEDLVSLKVYKAWKGRHYGSASWICLSYKSQKPIIYKFIPGLRIQNTTYKKLSQLFLGLSCRDWNLDHLYALMDLQIKWDIDLNIEKARLLLGAYSETRWLKLLEESLSTKAFSKSRSLYELNDAIEMFEELRIFNYQLPTKPRSISDLHGALINELEKKRGQELKDVVLPQRFSSLEGLKVGRFRLVNPKIGNDLISWGRQLNNCLISYVKKVFNEEYSVIGVLEKNQIKYALGIRDRHIEQFYGVSNSLPAAEHDRLIREILKTYRVS